MNRGQNDLLEACTHELERAAFRADLIFTIVVLGVLAIAWGWA